MIMSTFGCVGGDTLYSCHLRVRRLYYLSINRVILPDSNVWPFVGPVSDEPVSPYVLVQSKSSVLSWIHPQVPLSKLHSTFSVGDSKLQSYGVFAKKIVKTRQWFDRRLNNMNKDQDRISSIIGPEQSTALVIIPTQPLTGIKL